MQRRMALHSITHLSALSLLVAMLASVIATDSASAAGKAFSTGNDDPVVQFINERIRVGWEDNEISPSEVADDAEWLRRVYLDLNGRIPDASTIERFMADKTRDKRAKMIDQLIESPAFNDHMTTVWTNLLIGRQTPQRTNRSALEQFLHQSFTENKPYNDLVYELLTAEGHYEENGAVNFLLAQFDGNPNGDDYAVEATAKVTKLFLGMQVQCTQCHNHPFNDWKQNQFWEFNSFMRQVRRMDHRKLDPETGQMVDDYSELVPRNYTGPVFFEKRSGVMQVAYPSFFGEKVEDGDGVDRREALAAFVAKSDPEHHLAQAMVNRTWGQLFGYGFTKPVDDMGPHNPSSHPELLERLSEEFVTSGYDIRQLMRWITNTEAYNLTSQFNRKNEIDAPSAGEVPLFSHMYVKTMSAEQLYDSLIVATTPDVAIRGSWNGGGDMMAMGMMNGQMGERERWLRDFLRIFGGNDDDEPTMFSGTIPQALMMMNGQLVQKAIEGKDGTLLKSIAYDPKLDSDQDRIRKLFLSTLSRLPSSREASASRKLLASAGSQKWVAFQDLYWALLNSNEFVLNH